jgi:ankyrin repeat protein
VESTGWFQYSSLFQSHLFLFIAWCIVPTDRSEPTLPNFVCRSLPVEYILERMNELGVDIDEVDFKGWSGLHWALVREAPKVIKLLLDSGANPNLATGTGRLPLNIAMRSGQVDAVQMLLASGADPEAADSDGKTPRIVCMSGKYPELVNLLDL